MTQNCYFGIWQSWFKTFEIYIEKFSETIVDSKFIYSQCRQNFIGKPHFMSND